MYKTLLSAKVITLYPELFPGPLSASVTGRALENKTDAGIGLVNCVVRTNN